MSGSSCHPMDFLGQTREKAAFTLAVEEGLGSIYSGYFYWFHMPTVCQP